MGRLFGTDGIRGVANRWPLTADFAVRIGQGIARVIGRRDSEPPLVLVGRDTRRSGHMLESALAAGLTSQGVDVALLGVITTPGVAYLTLSHHAQLGVVVSASHNLFDHNGIKLFGPDGFKVPDEVEAEIERLLLDSEEGEYGEVAAGGLGRIEDAGDWRREYVDHLVGAWQGEDSLRGWCVVLDCANGATSGIAPEVFRRLGADVVVMEDAPDGSNINERYEYIRPESVRKAVLRHEASAGIAFDGDGDRVIMVDERGGYVNGDAMLAILARDRKRRGLLTNNAVVSTPMSNWGLKVSLEEVGIRLEEVSVGDRFVLQRMTEENYALGGEQSGHLILLGDERTTGDGIYTALAVLMAVVAEPGQSLSRLASCIREFPETLISVDVPHKPPLQALPEVQAALGALHAALGDDVDVTLRYSGTEDKLRLKIRAGEGHSQRALEKAARAFVDAAGRAIERAYAKIG